MDIYNHRTAYNNEICQNIRFTRNSWRIPYFDKAFCAHWLDIKMFINETEVLSRNRAKAPLWVERMKKNWVL